jgi:repressor LexA
MVDNEFSKSNESVIDIPLLGKITEGSPIEEIENPDEYFSLPAQLLPRKKEMFTLLVNG